MTPYPWYKKINPLWWAGNADDPVNRIKPDGTPAHPNFYPNKPLWIRKLMWGIRNPLHNFVFFVIGLEDQPEIVNADIKQWPKDGQKWNVILPFISYRGKKKEFYLGWRGGKRVGVAWRNSNAKPQ